MLGRYADWMRLGRRNRRVLADRLGLSEDAGGRGRELLAEIEMVPLIYPGLNDFNAKIVAPSISTGTGAWEMIIVHAHPVLLQNFADLAVGFKNQHSIFTPYLVVHPS